MADLDDQHDQSAIFNPANDPPIANPVAPKTLHLADKRVSTASWVIEGGDVFEVRDDLRRIRPIELVELPVGSSLKLNGPGQGGASHLRG